MATKAQSHEGKVMIVWLDVWGVRGVHRLTALSFMARHRRSLHRTPGLTFAKLLGTGSGDTFTISDADLGHWAVLTTWRDSDARLHYERSRSFDQWRDIAHESAHIQMRPIASHGEWSGTRPFDTEGSPVRPAPGQPVASITRARLKPHRMATFWRSVPPVVDDLRTDPGVLFTLGIGEAPVGLQGTFSVWSSGRAMSDFAYRRPAHQGAIERTHTLQWYSEELFARFAVESVTGTYAGEPVL
jgi:hypothetical protein